MKIKTIQDFIFLSPMLDKKVVDDVKSRIVDWLSSGGTETDPYIKQQLRYIERLINTDIKNKEFRLDYAIDSIYDRPMYYIKI